MIVINGRDALQMLNADVESVRDGNWQIARKAISPDDGINELFDVEGKVLVQGVVGVITTDITRTGAVEGKVGTETIDDLLIGVTTNIKGVAGLVWFSDTDPAVTAAQVDLGEDFTFIIGNEDNIILTLSHDPDAGALEFYCFWKPLSQDGSVAPA